MSLEYSTTEALFDRYDAFLIDQFGVLMSGDGPYPGAVEALSYLGKLGKPTLILSNSGKRSAPNCARLVGNGFARGDFETVLTSGEVAYHFMLDNMGRSIPRGGHVLVLIRQGDSAPLEGIDLVQTEDAEAANLLLIVSRDPARDLGTYQPLLEQLAARDVPCLCLNPDIKMLTPTGLMSAAGHLAGMYLDAGGRVQWFGKPHGLIYEHARRLIGVVPPDRVLCIGDSLSHDIRGGRNAGFATALVRTGIHADLSEAQVVKEAEALNAHPDHYLHAFRLAGRR